MPLSEFQKTVLTVLARNQSPESHFAGGIISNATDDSPRFSRDFDIFHEVAGEVVRASEADIESLRSAHFNVEPAPRFDEWTREATFRAARVRSSSGEVLAIDWAADSAFRFFPIVQDPLLGWRLHHFDAATNKALTLAARTETRDYIDILELHQQFPLAAICWAACGKDPGFTPLSLLSMMRRFARVDPVAACARALTSWLLAARPQTGDGRPLATVHSKSAQLTYLIGQFILTSHGDHSDLRSESKAGRPRPRSGGLW